MELAYYHEHWCIGDTNLPVNFHWQYAIAIAFLFFSYRLVRLTSPNLNYLIGTGAIILYVDIYFFVIPTTNQVAVTVFCNVSHSLINMDIF